MTVWCNCRMSSLPSTAHGDNIQVDKFMQEVIEVLLKSHNRNSHLSKSQEGVNAVDLTGKDVGKECKGDLKFAEAKSGNACLVVKGFILLASWILVHAVAA